MRNMHMNSYLLVVVIALALTGCGKGGQSIHSWINDNKRAASSSATASSSNGNRSGGNAKASGKVG